MQLVSQLSDEVESRRRNRPILMNVLFTFSGKFPRLHPPQVDASCLAAVSQPAGFTTGMILSLGITKGITLPPICTEGITPSLSSVSFRDVPSPRFT
ncbi:uncharacterized [Tachysurus ichikawai]